MSPMKMKPSEDGRRVEVLALKLWLESRFSGEEHELPLDAYL